MASKKRRSKEFLRRSAASKLGWQRRKEIAVLTARLGSEVAKARRPTTHEARIAELEKVVAENEELISFLKKAAVKHLDPAIMAKFRRDGNLAFQASILRHTLDADVYLSRLQEADQRGALHSEAVRIAQESQTSLQEVYTLFASP